MRRLRLHLGAAVVGLSSLVGCATGSPVGGRAAASALRYRPLSPPSAPRPVPAPAPPVKVVEKPAPPASPAPSGREEVVRIARELIGRTRVRLGGRAWPADCTGFVEAVYAQVGIEFGGAAGGGDNAVTSLYRYAQVHGRIFDGGRPLPGDLVFFRETYDQNRDGRRNDGLTHVGIVEAIEEPAGTVTVIHRVQRGVVRYRMNLQRPSLARDPRTGERLNDVLRAPGPGKSYVLAGQLFAAYATLLPSGLSAPVARR